MTGFGGDLVNRIKKGDGTMYCHLFFVKKCGLCQKLAKKNIELWKDFVR